MSSISRRMAVITCRRPAGCAGVPGSVTSIASAARRVSSSVRSSASRRASSAASIALRASLAARPTAPRSSGASCATPRSRFGSSALRPRWAIRASSSSAVLPAAAIAAVPWAWSSSIFAFMRAPP